MKRRAFLTAASAAISAPAFAEASLKPQVEKRRRRKALVLSGGGSLGAYQAGAIAGLARQSGVRDGEPLGFDMVCGTSIGALNGYFVATAQYSTLEHLWRNVVGTRKVLEIKHPYETLREPSSGVVTRMRAGMKLGRGLVKGVKGVLDTSAFHELLAQYVHPSAEVHIPFYVATTNLTRQESRMFVRRATTAEGTVKQTLNDELAQRDVLTRIRVLDDRLLRGVLYASAAIPIAFDPVTIPRSDGSGEDEYVDGGVTENVPVNLARHCVEQLYVILVNPPHTRVDVAYDGAVGIGLGVFATMQRLILEYQVLWALAQNTAALPFSAYLIQPNDALPGKFADFNDAAVLNEIWQIGYADSLRGWQPFVAPVET